MVRYYGMAVWKQSPFIRLLLPLILGIIIQWYLPLKFFAIVFSFFSFGFAYFLFSVLPISIRFKLRVFHGLVLNLLMLTIGLLVTWQNDIRNSGSWYGDKYQKGDYLVVTIDEPLIEKAKTFKTTASIEAIIQNKEIKISKGKILLYFSKDSFKENLQYGDKIIVHKNLQPIKNSGNPGAFNYQRYSSFQQLHHTVYLKNKDWQRISNGSKNVQWFTQFIYNARAGVLDILRKNIDEGKDELSIAQALLIGYTNDLDKDLVQAYSNTGVVHIIAISGMHLGLIYVMLIWFFAKIPFINKSKKGQLVLILSSLWLFAILTGASPSVLRAAVMFSSIAIGKNFSRQSSIYNSLAASAFVLLCFNPYYLWDVGFQLSYLAVLGIVMFQKPISNLLYIRHKWLRKIWDLMAVSTAAQLLAFPVCIYYFHQFPNMFLISNLLAVPLAAIILYAEIALVGLSWIPIVAIALGKITGWLLWLLNSIILWINDLSFSVWDKIPASVSSTFLLYMLVIASLFWLMNKNKKLFTLSMATLLLFAIQLAYGRWESHQQKKIIVYNVPQYQAIDFVQGNDFLFVGDSVLLKDGMLQNFHLKPGRIAMQLNNSNKPILNYFSKGNFYLFNNKRILIINQQFKLKEPLEKMNFDLIILSKNPTISLTTLLKYFNCPQFVFDASNSAWKIEKWQKECDAMNLRFHSIPTQGAFIYNTQLK